MTAGLPASACQRNVRAYRRTLPKIDPPTRVVFVATPYITTRDPQSVPVDLARAADLRSAAREALGRGEVDHALELTHEMIRNITGRQISLEYRRFQPADGSPVLRQYLFGGEVIASVSIWAQGGTEKVVQSLLGHFERMAG